MSNAQHINDKGNETMTSRHEARYTTNDDNTYAYIIRVDRDGFSQVILGFKPRHFANRKNAERAISKHFARFLNN